MGTIWNRLEGLLHDFWQRLPQLAVALVLLVLSYGAGRLIEAGLSRATRRRVGSRSLALAIGRLARWLVVLLGLLVGLTVALPSFRPADLVELLGIWSVAVGFAFRDVLQNFLAGILILIARPFREGDQIVVAGYEGNVTEIQARATLIRTYDGRRVCLPNATIFTQPVTINTAFETRRVEYDVGIGYGDDVERARGVIEAAMRGVDGVRAEPAPRTLVVALAPSSIQIRCWWWSDSRRLEMLEIQGRVIAAIRAVLKENGIDAPFPTQQVLFHDQTEEADGDRRRQREGWPAGESPPKPRTISGALESLARALRGPSGPS